MVNIVKSAASALIALPVAIVLFYAINVRAAGVNFAGRSITMIIPSGVGGGTDAMARLTGRFLSGELPGKPSVIYQNMPGASGVSALNFFVSQVKPDGLTSFVGSASNIDPSTLRNPAVKYNPKSLEMFGGFPAPDGVLILRKEAVDRFNDRSARPAIMGDDSAVRTSDQMAVWGPNYLGWNVRWVTGYPGSSEIVLAALRGEIDMLATYDESIIAPLDQTGKFVYPAQTGIVRDGKLVRGTRFPNVPVFGDLIRSRLTTPRENSAFSAWQALVQIGKWMALPPGADPDVLAAYRRAFAAVTSSSEFKSEAIKILGPDFTISSGEETEQMTKVADSISVDELKVLDELREKVGITVATSK